MFSNIWKKAHDSNTRQNNFINGIQPHNQSPWFKFMAILFYQWDSTPGSNPKIQTHGKLFIRSPIFVGNIKNPISIGNIKKPSSYWQYQKGQFSLAISKSPILTGNIKSPIYVGTILSIAQDY